MSLTKFTLFPQLPKELQLEILQWAATRDLGKGHHIFPENVFMSEYIIWVVHDVVEKRDIAPHKYKYHWASHYFGFLNMAHKIEVGRVRSYGTRMAMLQATQFTRQVALEAFKKTVLQIRYLPSDVNPTFVGKLYHELVSGRTSILEELEEMIDKTKKSLEAPSQAKIVDATDGDGEVE